MGRSHQKLRTPLGRSPSPFEKYEKSTGSRNTCTCRQSQAFYPGFTPVCYGRRLRDGQGFSTKCDDLQCITSGNMLSCTRLMRKRTPFVADEPSTEFSITSIDLSFCLRSASFPRNVGGCKLRERRPGSWYSQASVCPRTVRVSLIISRSRNLRGMNGPHLIY